MFEFQEEQEDSRDTGAVLSGDGRFDSPGWSAKFLTYFLQVNFLPPNNYHLFMGHNYIFIIRFSMFHPEK
jgi:hypothetical protein